MNIFVLNSNPYKIPKHYCDKHVVKMILETAQLLCSAHEQGTAPYKRTHYNHPCSIWARASLNNYRWLCSLGIALGDEYYRRYKKFHKSLEVINWCIDNVPQELESTGLTPFVQCMPDEYKDEKSVLAYRKYYASKLKDFRARGICKFTRN